MGLTSPLALLAIAFVGLPLLAHWIQRSRLPVRRLPTVVLLRAMRAESAQQRRFVDVGLLTLRIAALALATLAAAAPYWLASTTPEDAVESVVVVVDTSLSMQQTRDGQSAFDAARIAVLAELDRVSADSEVGLVVVDSPSRVVARLGNAASVRLAMETLRATGRAGDLAGALRVAARLVASGRMEHRRLVVVSDFAGVDPSTFGDVRFPLEVRPVGAGGQNARLVEVEVAEGDPVVVRGATEGSVAPDARVELEVVGQPVASTPIVDGRWELRVSGLPVGANLHLVSSGDRLPLDDSWPLEAQRALLRVLLVGDAAADLDPLERALRSLERPLRVVRSDTSHALEASREQDVVFVVGVASAAELRRGEVGARPALVWWPSAAVARPRDELIPGVTLGGREAWSGEGVRGPEGAHTGLERLQVTQRLRLDAGAARMRLRFADGEPFLVEEADTAIMAVGLGREDSDLVLRVGFVPLVAGLLERLAGRRVAVQDGPLSELRWDAHGVVEVELPSGELRTLEPRQLASLESLGRHRLRAEDGSSRTWLVRPPAGECDLTPHVPTLLPRARSTVAVRVERPLARWVALCFGIAVLAEGVTRVVRGLRRPGLAPRGPA